MGTSSKIELTSPLVLALLGGTSLAVFACRGDGSRRGLRVCQTRGKNGDHFTFYMHILSRTEPAFSGDINT